MSDFYAPSLRELIDRSAEKYGDAPFIKYVKDNSIIEKSFGQLQKDCNALCRYIRNLSGERMHIAVLGRTSYEYIVSFSAVLLSGNVAVPFSAEISAEEAADLFERADIQMLLYEDAFSEKAAELSGKCPMLRYTLNFGDSELMNKIYEDFSDSSQYADLSDLEVDKDKCAVIIYTSGTTGVKKGVMLSSNALIGNIMYHDYCTDIFNENDVSLSVLPMYHCYCLSGDYIKNLKDGLQLCLNENMGDLVSNLTTFNPKVMRVVPKIAQTLLRKVKLIMNRNPDMDKAEAVRQVFGNNIQFLISGGAYLDPELAAEYGKLGIFIRQGYGMTEAGCRISVPDDRVAAESVGRVTEICTVRVRNGEIQVMSPTLMMGYYKMPEQTAEMFTRDGWLKTGDIGIVTEDNQLFITGRVKNLIILSNGENVSPEAIEKKFEHIPLVNEIMVYGENDNLVAEIYPDTDYAALKGISDIYGEFEKIIDEMNTKSKSSHIISVLKLRGKSFERTESGKIKRKNTGI